MEQNLPFDLDALLVFGKVVEKPQPVESGCYCSECPSPPSAAS